MLTVTKTEEAGFSSAMRGLALSKKQPIENMPTLAIKLATRDGGHNKFLESIMIWCEVRAPRYWWQEGDTFRLSSKQSESTMHTLIREIKDFNYRCDQYGSISFFADIDDFITENFEPDSCTPAQMALLIQAAKDNDITAVKRKLPEGFLQRRVWRFDYKCFRNMILQRRDHRLPLWPQFINSLLEQVDHPELLPKGESSANNDS